MRWIAAALASLMFFLSARADTITVYVYNFEFSTNPDGGPVADAVVTAGDTVRWVWAQGNHTTTSVASSPEQWDAVIDQNATTFQRVFNTPGVFHYYCRPHGFDNGDGTAGGMAGTITVLPAGTGACCLPNGDCLELSQAACFSAGGTFSGIGSVCTPSPCSNQPITLTLPAVADSGLHETTDGSIANGAGQHFYTGNTNSAARRRGLVRFDLASLPPGIEVLSAHVRLFCNLTQGVAVNVSLSRMLAQWGEGTSDPGGNESNGAAPTTNDATWIHRFYNTQLWSTPGGDFVPTPSGSRSIATAGAFHDFTSAGIIADVQAWADGTAPNFGWIVRGDEATSANTKRFASRQTDTPANAPQLVLTYRFAATGACCLPDGSCDTLTQLQCSTAGGTYHGDGTDCADVTCPVVLTPFVDALPRPGVAVPVSGQPGGAAHYDIAMTEQFQRLHRDLPLTRVWGYAGSYPGPTIEARRGQTVTVQWRNDLRVAETGQLRTTHVFPIDECLHGPDMTGQTPVTVVHVHGAKDDAASDGPPEATFPPGTAAPYLYTYPNNQPAGTIWYHDHALGITRLNVYMGLAGFFLIRDDAEDALNIPRGEFEVPLAIQDRSFNTDGSLRYHNMWMDHFFGDTALVNGKVWPFLDVKRGKYRFRMLNGSNSRVYTLALSNGATFWQIGSDQGLLSAPVPMTSLTITPGERADVVIDFAPYPAGTQIVLTNSAPAPYPSGLVGSEIPEVMLFVVRPEAGDTDPLPAALVPVPPIPEAEARRQRDFELAIGPNMCPDHHDGVWKINGLMWHDITEFPTLGTTEIWAWRNRSAITHPMHMHLVGFQVLDRQDFDVVTGLPTGPRIPAPADEAGWKDTVAAHPGQITRVITRFEGYTGLFPYHCHILEHEDHEMMRQFHVVCPADFSADGFLDFTDFDAFVSAFEGGDSAADFNGDGFLDFTDFDAFVTAFEAGC